MKNHATSRNGNCLNIEHRGSEMRPYIFTLSCRPDRSENRLFPDPRTGFVEMIYEKDGVPEGNKVNLGSYKQHMKLFVAGLPYDFDDTDLKEMFELYGEVSSAKVAIDRETRKSRGFGFLEMSVALEAKEAIDALHGARLRGGKELVVREAEEKPRDNRNSGGFRPRR